MADATTPRSINDAAHELIEVLTELRHLEEFGRTVQTQIEIRRNFVDSTNPSHAPAVDAFKGWRALANLIEAVESHRSQRGPVT